MVRYNMLMVILLLVSFVMLIIASALRPCRPEISQFELDRRTANGDQDMRLHVLRANLQDDVYALRHILIGLGLVLVTCFAVLSYGWTWGAMLAVAAAIAYPRLSSFGVVRSLSDKFYRKYETAILQLANNMQPLTKLLRVNTANQQARSISSRAEVAHIIDSETDGILSRHEQSMMRSMLSFDGKKVKDYMTPRSVMNAIGVNELVGPLVMDDLYKTGHSHFPVLDGDIDHIVGILHIHTLMTIHDKDSKTVKEMMEPRVFYIHEDQALEHALSACIKHRRHLLVVINSYRETVGVITIEDAVEQLIGRKIVDEFVDHDDLRAVAERNPNKNNLPKNHRDV